MAQVDSSIPLGVKPFQMPDQMNALARAMQIKGLQQQGEFGQMKMDEYRSGVARKNRLTELLGQEYAQPEERENALLRGGFLDEAAKLGKDRRENVKMDTETDAKKLETATKRLDLLGQTLGYVRANPTIENATAAIQHLVDNGAMPAEKAQEAMARFQSNPTPQAIAQFAEMGFRAALSAKDQLPKLETRNLGGTTDTLAIDPVTQQVSTVNRAQNTQSPDSRASTAASYANANARIAAAKELAGGARDAARIKGDRDTEMKLADDYRAQSKPFKEVADAHKIITASLDKATTSPAATLAGATKFMKLLDPGSVVRESELGMALAATGVFDRASNYFNTLQRGQVLTKKQAADFKDIAGKIYQAAQKSQQQIDSNYQRQAQTYGLRPEMIVQDLGQNAGGGEQAANPQIDELLKKYGGK